jgi:hypothetical protein
MEKEAVHSLKTTDECWLYIQRKNERKNSKKQSPFWEANRSASPEIPHILWNPWIHYCVHRSPTIFPVLS